MADVTQTGKTGITALDIRMAVSVVICYLISTIAANAGLTLAVNDRNIEVIQKMTACIACMLCCQDNLQISWKSGVNRLIITVIGGLVGIGVIVLDNLVGNTWIMAILMFAGIILTLLLCKVAKVPYINARIGGVTFILVTCTLQSTARVYYGCFRLLSTVVGVLVVMLVTWIFSIFSKG